jgi:hypothetical protein
MPRLIRRRPLTQRLQDYLNPYDWALWLSEEFESSDWDDWARQHSTYVGLGLNVIFVLARANVDNGSRRGGDDVFGDYDPYSRGTGWLGWFVGLPIYIFLRVRAITDGGALGIFHNKPPRPFLDPERPLHLHPHQTLPPLRKPNR